jgi:hypothetical protein
MSNANIEKLTGSCLCNGVSYEISGGVGDLTHCHCSMCRKMHGAAFSTYAPVAWAAFKFIQGEDLISDYRSSEDVTRTFCRACGSTLQFIRDDRPGFGLAVGTLDDDPGRRPTAQIWVSDKAAWWDLQSEPPCYDTYPAARDST